MIRFLFLRVVVPLLLIWVIRGLVRSLFGGNSRVVRYPGGQVPPKAGAGGELKKDPVCGTYVSTDTAVIRRIDGQTVHFCSPACRDKYRAAS